MNQPDVTASTSQPLGATLEKFKRAPVAPIVVFALLAVGAVALMVRGLTATAVARCQGEAMSPGDICRFTVRGRRTGTRTVVNDYDSSLLISERTLSGQQLGGALAALAAVALIVLFVLAWRRDVAQLPNLMGENPDVSHADRGVRRAMTAGIFAVVLIGLGGYLLHRIHGDRAEWSMGLLAFPILFLLGGLALLVGLRPRGGSVIMASADGLGVLSRNTRSNVAYTDVLDFGEAISWQGHSGRVSTAGKDAEHFRQVLGQRVQDAWASTVESRLQQGETLRFGDLSLSPTALVIGRSSVPLTDIAEIRVERDKNGQWLAVKNRSGKNAGRVAQTRVGNLAVLRALLAQRGVHMR